MSLRKEKCEHAIGLIFRPGVSNAVLVGQGSSCPVCLLWSQQMTYGAHCSWAHKRRAFFADICHLSWALEHFLAGGLEVGDESASLTLSREGRS